MLRAWRPSYSQHSYQVGHCWRSKWALRWRAYFLRRVPMLKTCPHFMRGRLRDCFRAHGEASCENGVW